MAEILENDEKKLDVDVTMDESTGEKMKEYEKLLISEANRKLMVKADTMIKLGLFEQKTEKTIDFSDLVKVSNKKYRGKYDLFNSIEGQLIYIYGKNETDSVDDVPYEYDVIYIDNVTEEEYAQIKEASTHEKIGMINFFRIVSFVLFFASLALIPLYIFICMTSKTVNFSFALVVVYGASLVPLAGILGALSAILEINYRKFKNNK